MFILAWVPVLLLFVSFLLLLLVSLSAPIIGTIYLAKFALNVNDLLLETGVSGNIKFGVWGYCVSKLDVQLLGTPHDYPPICSAAKLGYDFGSTSEQLSPANGLQSLISSLVSKALAQALVVHPISCGLTFLALLTSIQMALRPPKTRFRAFLALGSHSGAASLITSCFGIDAAVVSSLRANAKASDPNGEAQWLWGGGVWMVLAAMILAWGSLAVGALVFCRERKVKKDTDSHETYEFREKAAPTSTA